MLSSNVASKAVSPELNHYKMVLADGPHGLKKCVGVEFIKDGAKHKTPAPLKDVIISAGTLWCDFEHASAAAHCNFLLG